MEKDLFGKKIKKRRSRLEILLAKQDRDSLLTRVERIKYLRKITPSRMGLLGSMESVFVFQEAQAAYVNGQFIATIMLSQAFIEKVMQSQMEDKGYPGAARGLKYMVKYCRDNNLLPSIVLDKIEHLRKIRNPFSHLKPISYPYKLDQRIFRGNKKGPEQILEDDAKEALSTMLTVLSIKVL